MKLTTFKIILFVFTITSFLTTSGLAQKIDIHGPVGSVQFGREVVPLPNGNIVVTDPDYSIPGGAEYIGAVYLYNGATGELISKLTGSNRYDTVGNGGITVLSNGNYVISSRRWSNGEIFLTGAVTFANGETGVSGVVSELNSLIGTGLHDFVGRVQALKNGNYVVTSEDWNDGASAITFGNGTKGVIGKITASNSLVGSVESNQDKKISSPKSPTGLAGSVYALSPFDDYFINITELANGNFVVGNQYWFDSTGAGYFGATTFVNGETGIAGVISASNSLVGSSECNFVGRSVTPLTNGNYVVDSNCSNSDTENVQAIVFADGKTGIKGVVSESNSLIIPMGDYGTGAKTALANGNYVVSNQHWDNGQIKDVGIVTLVNGNTGRTGVISASDSLIGSSENDYIGNSITALSNGNYVITSSSWSNGNEENVGAVTFGDGTTGVTGRMSESNSLVGSSANDNVGDVRALTNGNYVVTSPNWDKDGRQDVGAVTFANGVTGITGEISESNSLIGSKEYDRVGKDI